MRLSSFIRAVAAGCAFAAALAAVPARAQTVFAPVDDLEFDRPESWALKYFTSGILMTGLEMPEAPTPGSLRIGFDFAWIPSLSAAQEKVGFNGTKQEDLNKAPVFGRPRVSVALPGRFLLTVAGNPPISTFGVTPKFLGAAIAHSITEGAGWNLGWRVSGQGGTAKAAFTCPQDVLAFTPGDPGNSYGCRQTSSDTATLRFVSGELDGWRRLQGMHGLSPHFTVALTYMNNVFQVNAYTFNFIDQTRLLASGVTVAGSGGVEYPLTDRISASVDVFYTPLTVTRPPATSSSLEGMFNVRGLVSYRVR